MAVVRDYGASVFDESATTDYTLVDHQLSAGANRLVVVAGAFMRTSTSAFTVTVTYGGAAMTTAVQQTTTSTSRYYRAGIWYLPMGSGAQSLNNVVATANGNISSAILYAVTLLGVEQASPLEVTDNNTDTPTALSLGYSPGGPVGIYSLWMAMSTGNSTGWSASSSEISPFEVFERGPSPTSSSEVSAAGYDYIWPGTDDIASVTITRDGSPPAQVGVAAKFTPAATESRPLFRRSRTYIRM